MKEQLTDLQLAKIAAFVADQEMCEAVRSVLLAGVYKNGVIKAGEKHNPLINGAFGLVAESSAYSNEQYGEQLRGMWAGVSTLEGAFDKMKELSAPTDE
ncbi:hypothetical protein KAT92_05955, partial [Candidatus Babeliales bacterium]|nr:hypothetical protein [Candidatus Babeliales bacterium]